MAFYTVDLKVSCDSPSCSKRATKEVKASGTQSYGQFCAACAKKRIKSLEKSWGNRRPI